MWLIVGRRWILLVQPEKPKRNSSKKKEARLLGVARAIFRVHLCEVSVTSNLLNMYCRSRDVLRCANRISPRNDEDEHPLLRSRVGGLGPLTLWHIPLVLASNEACISIKRKIEMHAGSLQSNILDGIEKIVVNSVRDR